MRRDKRPKEPAWTLEAAPLKTAGVEAAAAPAPPAGAVVAATMTVWLRALTEAATELAMAVGTVRVTVDAAPAGPQPHTAVTVVHGMVGVVWDLQPQPVAVTVPVYVTVVRPPGQVAQTVT